MEKINFFLDKVKLDINILKKITKDQLSAADFGELYIEKISNETIYKDKKIFSNLSIGNSKSGFSIRAVEAKKTGFYYSNDLNIDKIKAGFSLALEIQDNKENKTIESFFPSEEEFYPQFNNFLDYDIEFKIAFINKIEKFVYDLDPKFIENVSINYSSSIKEVLIINKNGDSFFDVRPISSIYISLSLKNNEGKIETSRVSIGGVQSFDSLLDENIYQKKCLECYEIAKELLKAKPAPAGIMDVVLSPGWAAVLLHEAIGHGLEGDFNRKGISVYSGKIGKKVANDCVTVIDQGNIAGGRGSINFDDEGNPSSKNILIENGILKKYIFDQQSAMLMNTKSTGNGRRQGYEYIPMPRMTNTYFANGTEDPKDIIKSVKKGLYISYMGGGQVDITSGKFNMVSVLAYEINDGKLGKPIKGATLVGDGLTVINSISMIGNDLKLCKNAGMCGKNGQSIVVGCGQPTIKVSNMTVGGQG